MKKFLKKYFSKKESYVTSSKTIWLIPYIIGFTRYDLRANTIRKFFFVGFSLNILMFEIKFFTFKFEPSIATSARKYKPKPQPKVIHVFQNPENGKCMFVEQNSYEYEDSILGFDYVKSIKADDEDDMVKKLIEYEEELNSKDV